MSHNVKKVLLAVAIVGLVAIPVAAVALGGPAGFAQRGEAGAGVGFVGSGGVMGGHAGGSAVGRGLGHRMGDHGASGPMWMGDHGASGPMRMGDRGASGPMRMGMFGDMAAVDSEFDYLAHMIPHHEEAIASAELLLAGTQRPEMKVFARDIIDTQSAEVVQMQTWLAQEYPERDVSVHYEPMMRDLAGLSGDELDRAFLEDMVGHHMAAVMMSQQLLAGGLAERPEVVPFAEQIRDSQHAEIMQMRVWLADWFGQDAMGPMGPMGSMGSLGPMGPMGSRG